MFKTITLCALGFSAAMWAADRPDLNGVWQSTSLPADGKLKAEVLTIHQTDDAVQITDDRTARNGKESKEDIQCNTMGQECKLKGLQVSIYYNGEWLVLIETQHENVTKKRFSQSGDGKTLSLEVTHMAPGDARTETLTFTRQKT